MKRRWPTMVSVFAGLLCGFGWATLWFPVFAHRAYAIPAAVLIPFLLWFGAFVLYRKKFRKIVLVFLLTSAIFTVLSLIFLIVMVFVALQSFT
ncbi:hypothetical protein JZ785_17285 [Alicyclobacillus curvatus]|nr:hypothetical protein JZ785_17285 [Alicyclobacillus curvatus]